ncbi:magnesium transport protein corA [Asticcacaulis biprosthecium C19]|uniref:Magnesium transport protein corA n=1 Tax=Asticcacaulis biprosthecium C19 TaxID=715226 RepID=F4QJX5_9CAUL|nr:magnesium transporter CorA family protein [Asticcacaulis biprosthecium]EGF93232.1 magnesium transport protein corA [Asticcacaulis biprosthecium C19]
MLTLHTCSLHDTTPDVRGMPANVVWVDLHNPSREEELRMEGQLGVLLPTREDMAEIELSSRLYIEDGAAFMTAQFAYHGGQKQLQSGPVTFVLTQGRLVTIRYIDPATFKAFGDKIGKQPSQCEDGPTTFLNLLDLFIQRAADLIETSGATMESLSQSVFVKRRKTGLESVLIQLGAAQNDNARIRDSLASLKRLVVFASDLEVGTGGLRAGQIQPFRERLATMAQDVASLVEHTASISNNIAFLLEAALGLINVEQSTIIKLISITSVIFLPLTLIASIYGMNFDYMPFLHTPEAFWGVCGLMGGIIVVLLIWFKIRRWI